MLKIPKLLMNKKLVISLFVGLSILYLGHWLYTTGYANGKAELLEETLAAHQSAVKQLQVENQKILRSQLALQQADYLSILAQKEKEQEIDNVTEEVKTNVVTKIKYKEIPASCDDVLDDVNRMLIEAATIVGTTANNK